MKKIKLLNHLKSKIVFILFLLLTISITKSIVKIYASRHEPICVPIIMYHHVKNKDFGKDVISPYEFESDLQYLKENNFNTITMTQLIDYVYEDIDLPENPIILSFDDGYLNTYKYVYPMLKEYNMKIVLSIIGKSVDAFTKVCDTNINYASVTWDQVYEMEESGLVEIQNHSYNLHSTSNGRYGCYQKTGESLSEYEQFITEDIITLQEKVKLITNTTPNTFAYPYGKFNNNTDEVLKKIGFRATLSCKFGVNLINKNPEKLYDLKRICRSHKQSVQKLIKEGMETLKYVNE